MTVEVEGFYKGYNSSWDWIVKSKIIKLSNRCYTRLIREAREHFDGFGLDFSQYGEPKVSVYEEYTAQIEWTHKTSGKTITLNEIWFDKKTGQINQCGQNYGNLVS